MADVGTREFKLKRRSHCPFCGQLPNRHLTVAYDPAVSQRLQYIMEAQGFDNEAQAAYFAVTWSYAELRKREVDEQRKAGQQA